VPGPTTIEWCTKSWNFLRGCSLVSAGCTNCYAQRQAHRFAGPGGKYEGLTRLTGHGPRWTGDVRLVPELLTWPMRLRKPERIFVNSMSDLFHEDVPLSWIAAALGIMAVTPRQTYLVLTKRAERMRDVMAKLDVATIREATLQVARRMIGADWTLPLPNVHLGVSCEDQATADERIPYLLDTPAAVRWVSAEPLLGPIDFRARPHRDLCIRCGEGPGAKHDHPDGYRTRGLDWIVVGGESGPGARPFDLMWLDSIVEQTRAAKVPLFVKQWGAFPVDSGHSFGTFAPEDRRSIAAEKALGHAPHLILFRDRKGGDMAEWPEELRIRELPEVRA